MRLKRGLRAMRKLLAPEGRRASDKPPMEESQRTFRHIWHYLTDGSDKRFPLKRGQTNALVLQMSKVASTSLREALGTRGINAFHSHGLTSAPQNGTLSQLLESDLTFYLAAHDLRRHIQHVALHMLTRWYQRHKQYKGRRLKVITLTRDPVTHYSSAFVRRYQEAKADIIAWHDACSGGGQRNSADERQALSAFILELASILVEGQSSLGTAAYHRCISLARERWPEHPVVARETSACLVPLSWFDREITPVFDLDMLASSQLRERGWTEQSNDWVDIFALKYEELPSVLPEIQRFFDLAELALPRQNVTSVKPGAADIAAAMRSVLDTPVGQAFARELRLSPYGRACGYDKLT